MTRNRSPAALQWRILLAFGVVAVLSVGVVAALTVVTTRAEVESLVEQDHARTTQALAQEVAAAYRAAGGWEGADLRAAQAVAAAAGADLAIIETVAAHPQGRVVRSRLLVSATGGPVVDPGGTPKQQSPMAGPGRVGGTPAGASVAPSSQGSSAPNPIPRASGGRAPSATPPPTPSGGSSFAPAPNRGSATPTPTPRRAPTPNQQQPEGQLPITVDGSTVGAIVVTYPAATPADAAALQARDLILDRVALSAVLALLIAAAVSMFVARRIARPVTALTAAAAAVERGERDPVLPTRAPGELGRLARSFARMAKGLESAEQSRRAVVADVAHELRTPVTILRGNLEGMVDGVTPATPETLQSLHEEVLKLGRVLDDFAALAAADDAALQLDRAPLDLADVARQVVTFLATSAADAGVALTSSLSPAPVLGDETRLHQVLVNLVGNAIKFSAAGGAVHVCVRADNGGAEVTVSDVGVGIPPDELPHVFERFWRGERAVGRSGSGIGLAVVKQLVEAHGGTVSVTSSPGDGARFEVRIPATNGGSTAAPSWGER